jgi:hypothetical protein
MHGLKIGNVGFDQVFGTKICNPVDLEFCFTCGCDLEITGIQKFHHWHFGVKFHDRFADLEF